MSAHKFLKTLKSITGTGKFHSAGRDPFVLPGLHLDPLGEISFPLHPIMAEALKEHCEAAPYGKGEDTIRDDSVRKCWQIDSLKFNLSNPAWEKFIEKTSKAVATDLGIPGKVSAEPYKFLLYEKGGHFLPHRDTEKVGEMFGTLIVALPSAHEGGQLLIRHDGREITIDFSRSDANHPIQYAAFFADCEHEVLPVKSGYRCCLAYNLRLKKGDSSKLNCSLSEHSSRLVPYLNEFKKSLTGTFTAIPLEHRYTQANLSIRQLKNNDRARGEALFAAAEEAGLAAHLALATFHQMGELDNGYHFESSYRKRRGGHGSSGEETMGEVYEEDLSIDHWRDQSDTRIELGRWSISSDLITSDEEIGSGDPHEKEAEGFTGNAGCTMDYWYHHAVIVLWSPGSEVGLLTRYNLRGACEQFRALSKRKKQSGRFSQLGKAIIGKLVQNHSGYSSWRVSHDFEAIRVILQAIVDQSDEALLTELFDSLPSSTLRACDSEHWNLLLKKFPPAIFTDVIEKLPLDGFQNCRDTFFTFLESLLVKNQFKDAAKIARLVLRYEVRVSESHQRSTLDSLAELIGGSRFHQKAPGEKTESHILLAASYLLKNSVDRKKAIAFLHGDRSLEHLRNTLAPALLKKSLAKHFTKENSLFLEFLGFAIDTLESEISQRLEPYPDWTRPCPKLTSGSAPHKELEAFMKSSIEECHSFKYAQHIRSELESSIRNGCLDLDYLTLKKGTPHTLLCTKNSNSYQRALKRRKDDQALVKKLQTLQSKFGP